MSLRTQLLLAFLLVVGITGIVGILSGVSFISRTVLGEARARVEVDLGAAWAAFDEERSRLQMVVSLVSQAPELRAALAGGAAPSARLEELRRRHELDFLTLLGADGVALARSRSPYATGDRPPPDPVIEAALGGAAASGSLLVSPERLRAEGDDLTERAYVPLVFTERARATDRTAETRGMVLEAALPVLDGQRVVGVIYAGVLLNRKFALVDRIRDRTFGDRTWQGKPVGTVTFFLGDVRIATNVMMEPGTRALGTRVSREVYETVLERGRRFADRAFVVNDWYLSAYDPIRDPRGQTIGIIYVGLLEKRYLEYGARLARRYLAISLLAVLLSAAAALLLSARFRRPVERMLVATRQVARGEAGARVEPDGGSREMRELAQAFNSMAETLECRSRELQQAGAALQQAYTETAERNRAYLEMLGFVTHELKSPLASIVFAIGSLREGLLGPLNDAQLAALRSAAVSADSLHETITNYLNLSRIEEGALRLAPRSVAFESEIVAPLVERFGKLAGERQMEIASEVPEELVGHCDPALITSVLQNLLSNAVKYARSGGRIRIRGGRDGDGHAVRISVWNEGRGIAAEDRERLFRRFSRLEPGDTRPGTGLGLFVSRRIVESHGGKLWVESQPGEWAEFVMTLPDGEA